MPTNSPLTSTPMPELGDSPNIESATQPGFRNLEKYAIPRFSSTSQRNAAFNNVTPAIGQITYILAKEHLGYEVWNGSTWEEFGAYTRMRPMLDMRTSNLESSSGSFQTVCEIENIPAGNWLLEASVSYRWLEDDLPGDNNEVEFGLDYPQDEEPATMTYHILRHQSQESGNQANQFTQNFQTQRRTTGSFDMLGGLSNGNDVIPAVFTGTLFDVNSGNVTLRVRKRSGGGGSVRYYRGSWMKLTRMP